MYLYSFFVGTHGTDGNDAHDICILLESKGNNLLSIHCNNECYSYPIANELVTIDNRGGKGGLGGMYIFNNILIFVLIVFYRKWRFVN